MLLVNACDLDEIRMPIFGSPLALMIRVDMGDRLLGSIYDDRNISEMYFILECTDERAKAIADCLILISQRKKAKGRVIRCLIRHALPKDKHWHFIAHLPSS